MSILKASRLNYIRGVSDSRTKVIVQRVIKECGLQWRDYKEPMSIVSIGALINRALIDALGAGWNATRVCDWLEGKGIVKILRTRTGKQWVMLFDIWDALSQVERDALMVKIDSLTDPLTERNYALKANRAAKRSTR